MREMWWRYVAFERDGETCLGTPRLDSTPARCGDDSGTAHCDRAGIGSERARCGLRRLLRSGEEVGMWRGAARRSSGTARLTLAL